MQIHQNVNFIPLNKISIGNPYANIVVPLATGYFLNFGPSFGAEAGPTAK